MSPVSLREAGEGRVEGALRAQAMRDGRKSISSSMLLPFFMLDGLEMGSIRYPQSPPYSY